MSSLPNFFIEEINTLLSDYISQNEISRYRFDKVTTWATNIDFKGKFSLFDEEQLNVEFTPADDRVEIDKIITLAEKNFPEDKFYDFLLKIGQLCISHGKMNLSEEIFLKVARENENNLFKAESLFFIARLGTKSAHWENSERNIVDARNLFRTLGEKTGITKCENLLGTICANQGKLDEAEKHFENSHKLVDRTTEVELTAQIEMNLGIINNIKGSFNKAEQYFQSSLSRLSEVGSLNRIAEVRHNLGMMFLEQSKFENALKEFDESIKVSIEAGLQPMMGISYLCKATAYFRMNEYDLADAFATKSYDICYGLSDKQSLAEVYKIKGMIARLRKNFNDSENYLQSSLRLNEKFRDDLNLAETSFELAKLYGTLNKKTEEDNYLNQALQYYRKIEAVGKIKELQKLLDNRINF
ncbi:MAG: tetratricopeptide repeat protein [Ignavibacteria bacterium]|nr:tetratricopeptide repeat protein [Ignavibacteria bacterium]